MGHWHRSATQICHVLPTGGPGAELEGECLVSSPHFPVSKWEMGAAQSEKRHQHFLLASVISKTAHPDGEVATWKTVLGPCSWGAGQVPAAQALLTLPEELTLGVHPLGNSTIVSLMNRASLLLE